MENSPEQLNGGYDESNITVLEGLEAVRLRPGMYIGGVDSLSLIHISSPRDNKASRMPSSA